jgi:hypothetical protein
MSSVGHEIHPGLGKIASRISQKPLDGLLRTARWPIPSAGVSGAAMSKTAEQGANALTTAAMSKAASVIAQQQALIGELQSARLSAVKTAAALVEAAKLAQERRIDIEDLFEVADRLITSGTVKLSSYDERFDQSPGDVLSADAEGATKQASSQTSDAPTVADPLTATLRSIRQ